MSLRSTLMALVALAAASPAPADELLPHRVRRIVAHVLGGPSYDRPERRFVFLGPLETQALWKPGFGAHWIVWPDGALWPRIPPPESLFLQLRKQGLDVPRPPNGDAELRPAEALARGARPKIADSPPVGGAR